jgi:hypothetical protein
VAEIEPICHDMRQVYEMILSSSGVNGVTGSCMYASVLLRRSLERFGACNVRICGGDGAQDGGAIDEYGKWHGHYWAEGRTASGFELVADITADQFGFEPVVVMPLSTARSRYVPSDDKAVQEAVDKIEQELRSAIGLAA